MPNPSPPALWRQWARDIATQRRSGQPLSSKQRRHLGQLRKAWQSGLFTPNQVAFLKARGITKRPTKGRTPNLKNWWKNYHAVAAYKAKYGRLPPTKGHPLGIWLNNQRAKARRGELNPRQLAALCAIGANPNQPLPRRPRK